MSCTVNPSGKTMWNGFGIAITVSVVLPPVVRVTVLYSSELVSRVDDDALRRLLGDELRQARQPVVRAGALDDAERTGHGSGGIADGDACAGASVVEREHLHFSASVIACLPAFSASRNPAGFLPPAS